jgi:hypothetical protein
VYFDPQVFQSLDEAEFADAVWAVADAVVTQADMVRRKYDRDGSSGHVSRKEETDLLT